MHMSNPIIALFKVQVVCVCVCVFVCVNGHLIYRLHVATILPK